MISPAACSSRLPVGSSARRRSGSLTRARAIATRCCWPPTARTACGRCDRRAPRLRGRGDPAPRSRRGRSRGAGAPRSPGAGARQEVEGLEDEADPPVAQAGLGVDPELRDVLAVEPVAPGVGRSSRPRTFISVDFPDPEAPTTASISPALDAQRDFAQRPYRRAPRAIVGSFDPFELDHGPAFSFPSGLVSPTSTSSPPAGRRRPPRSCRPDRRSHPSAARPARSHWSVGPGAATRSTYCRPPSRSTARRGTARTARRDSHGNAHRRRHLRP